MPMAVCKPALNFSPILPSAATKAALDINPYSGPFSGLKIRLSLYFSGS